MARKSAKHFANTEVHILARTSAKLIANFSATMVTSLLSFSLSLSLSLYLSLYLSLSLSLSLSFSLSHRMYLTHNRKRFRASYNKKYQKLLEREKKIVCVCVRLRSGDKHHPRKSADRKAQIRKACVPLTGLI